MNAKKIMGAVLVALLAAALFVGAGAADDKYLGTVFVYEETDLTDGIWNGENGASITVTSGVVYPGANFVAGNYKNNGNVTYVTYPTATYAIGATIGANTAYLVANGGNVYSTSNLAIKVNASNTGNAVERVYLTYPNGTAVNTTLNSIQGNVLTSGDKGVYKIQAIFGTAGFVEGVPSNLLLDTVSALTFKVVGAEGCVNCGGFIEHLLNNLIFLRRKAAESVNKNKPAVKIIALSQNIVKLSQKVVGVEITARGHCVICIEHGCYVAEFHF
jgi:hypothetical protein